MRGHDTERQQAPDLAVGFRLLKPDQIKRERHLSMTPNGNDVWGASHLHYRQPHVFNEDRIT